MFQWEYTFEYFFIQILRRGNTTLMVPKRSYIETTKIKQHCHSGEIPSKYY